MREVLEDHISPADLSKKYNISAHSIRDWIKKAGHQLPKSYKRFPIATNFVVWPLCSAFNSFNHYKILTGMGTHGTHVRVTFNCMEHFA